MKERYQKFFEMATVGRFEDFNVQVYTDHEPIHFHILKKDQYEVRMQLSPLKVLSYKWQKDGKEVTGSDMKKIKKWLQDTSKKDKRMSNKDAIKFAWSILNENE